MLAYDTWDGAPEKTIATDKWIKRKLNHPPGRERDEPRAYKRGIPVTEQELAGCRINYCAERLARDALNDKRAAERKDLRPLGGRLDLIDIVNDACASAWDAEKYLAKHQDIVRQILDKPCNQRRRKFAGMSTMQRRHQKALRLVHALAFDGLTHAEYCRKHKIDKADASRMLAHLYEKEPGLADAIHAISACAAGISWQNRQQKQNLRIQERARSRQIQLVYGLNQDINSIGSYPDQASTPRWTRSGGGFRHVSLVSVDHDPDETASEWWAELFASSAFFKIDEKPRIVAQSTYRYQRPLAREVTLKTGKKYTWNPIGRAVQLTERGFRPHDHGFVMDWPVADHDFLKRPPAVLKMPPRMRPLSVSRSQSVAIAWEYVRRHGHAVLDWSPQYRPETLEEIKRDFFGLRPTGRDPWGREPKIAKRWKPTVFRGTWNPITGALVRSGVPLSITPARSRIWLAGVRGRRELSLAWRGWFRDHEPVCGPIWERHGNEDSLRKPHGIFEPFAPIGAAWITKSAERASATGPVNNLTMRKIHVAGACVATDVRELGGVNIYTIKPPAAPLSVCRVAKCQVNPGASNAVQQQD